MNITSKIDPVIIIGAGRSGTKFFRDMLMSDSSICAIPYDVNFIWRYGNEDYPHDELPISTITQNKIDYIRNSITTMALKNNPIGNILVEKTVSNCLRVPYVNSVFPNAKFIHLIRDGRAVTESAQRLWIADPEITYLLKKLQYFPWRNYRYAFKFILNIVSGKISNRGQKIWGPKYRGIEKDLCSLSLFDLCAKQWHECVQNAILSLSKIPDNRVHKLRYEDLVQSTESIYDTLEFIGIHNKSSILSYYKQNVIKSNINKWESILTDQQQQSFLNQYGDTLKTLNYI